MAADTRPDRFENVDWDEFGGGHLSSLPRRSLAFLVSLGLLCAAVAYDYFVVPDGDPTVAAFDWDVTGVDWLFYLTLVVLFFYAVVPLYANRRMTAYYWRQFRKNKVAVASLCYLLAILAIGTIVPIFIDPPQLSVIEAYQPPMFLSVSSDVPVSCVGPVTDGMCHGTMAHPLGTTAEGKDILKQVVFGMRVSMYVGLIAGLLIVVIGTTVGTVAAYGGGLIDEALMRYVDIQQTFPTFFLFLLLIYLFGSSLLMMILIFGFFSWGGIARLVRSEALQRTEEEYIRAADSAGAGTLYVIRRHIVPNVSNTVVTFTTLLIPSLLLSEAAIAFLGLADPTIPSWGRVISVGRNDLTTGWWISTIPGIFLFLTMLAFNFLGDALTDALDPRREH